MNEEKESAPEETTKAISLEVGEETVEEEVPSLTMKDFRWLKKSNYEEERKKYSTTYVLKHKTGKVAELKASTPFHACQMIKWKPNQCKVIDVREDESGSDSLDKADPIFSNKGLMGAIRSTATSTPSSVI